MVNSSMVTHQSSHVARINVFILTNTSHVVLLRVLSSVVKLLLRRNPQAAMARRGVGRLPLHYAIFADKPNLEVCPIDVFVIDGSLLVFQLWWI